MRRRLNRVVCARRRELPKYCHCCLRIRRRRRSRSNLRLRREERRWVVGREVERAKKDGAAARRKRARSRRESRGGGWKRPRPAGGRRGRLRLEGCLSRGSNQLIVWCSAGDGFF